MLDRSRVAAEKCSASNGQEKTSDHVGAGNGIEFDRPKKIG